MPFKDKEKKREWRKIWYARNRAAEGKIVQPRITLTKSERKKKHQECKEKRRLEVQSWFGAGKNKCSCCLCFEHEPAALDFHHVSFKRRALSEAVRIFKKEWLIEELKNCVVLCSNCHRKYHAGRIELSPLLPRANIYFE